MLAHILKFSKNMYCVLLSSKTFGEAEFPCGLLIVKHGGLRFMQRFRILTSLYELKI